MENKSTQEQSQEQPATQETVKLSPEEQAQRLVDQSAKAETVLAAFISNGKVQAAKFTDHYFDKLHSIIKFQGEELLIFHTLELLIKTGQVNELNMKEILEEIASLRVRAMEAAKADTTQQQQTQQQQQ